MFGKSMRLFKLFGFDVKVDISWFLLVIIIVWSLAVGLFPYYFKGLSTMTYWWMGVAGALGLFFSIVAHEFMHSLVARNSGLPIKGITLFIFGGVAHMEEEPPSAQTEFSMAIAGPITSVLLGVFFYVIAIVGKGLNWPIPVTAVLGYLGVINWVLAGFNLLPAFPLDGGRVLRSVLWRIRKNLRWATKTASQIGVGFSVLFMAIGVIQFFSGNVIGGVWIFMIGMFLQGASRMSYQQLITRQTLEGEKVKDFMKSNPITVQPSLSLGELINDYIYKYHFKMFPVVEHDRLVGCVSTRQLKHVPREQWKTKRVADIVSTCSAENVIDPETDIVKALSLMNRTGNSRLMVAEGDTIVGIITLKDIMNFLSIKLDLGEYEK